MNKELNIGDYVRTIGMKIIDILNKIANGEEPPKKIIHNNFIYTYTDNGYYDEKADDYLFDAYYVNDILNDEVEILETTITYKQDNIENNKQDKIEKIGVFSYDKCIHGVTHKEKELALEIRYTQNKINEIIDRVNADD